MPNIKITIKINTDNDAFQPDADAEMRRIFSDVESAIFHSERFGRGLDSESVLFDTLGNSCGSVRLEYDAPLCDGDGCNETAVTPRRVPHLTADGTEYGSELRVLCRGCADRHDARCETCDGSGEIEIQIGGDGYGGSCCALADVPSVCPDCDGTGKGEV